MARRRLGHRRQTASRARGTTYLGGDSFARLDPERAMRRLARQANAIGFTVRVDPIAAG
ncbi:MULTISPECIES: hypothetical protein [unclassified Streptomyces]|uniref:hypothetical protein n=1 Tax=unclassified Streptomyces TaxID=2593676 RepID=UPI00225133FA|nr:hypothetical protein [Streptomyces sp. NBC_00268]MCX5188914.1 hypothetical protein [Streptomyces sp. NBC_00268]